VLSAWQMHTYSIPIPDTPLDPSLFLLTAGVRMARTDVVAARIWYQRPVALAVYQVMIVLVLCMGSCSGKGIACRIHSETSRVELSGFLSLMTAVGTQFNR
jgi:hypothetical protein